MRDRDERLCVLEEMAMEFESPNRELALQLLADKGDVMKRIPAAQHTHHTWPGGYLDHVAATMDFACGLYALESTEGGLPFRLIDALLVLFLHDLEKLWKYDDRTDDVSTFDDELVRNEKVRTYGFNLSPMQWNALRYVEGEGADYTPMRRVMTPIAAFCHMCDVYSARLRPDEAGGDRLGLRWHAYRDVKKREHSGSHHEPDRADP